MKSDELLKQGYRLTHDMETHLISLVYFWDEETKRDDIRSSELVSEDVRAILASNPTQDHYGYVDLSLVGDLPTDIPMKSLSTLTSLLKEDNLKRVAVVGGDNYIKKFAEMAIKIASGGKLAWFTDIQAAKEWLYDKKSS